MVKSIGKLFNVNPFMGGLGNREGDAIAYYHGGISLERIFIIDTKSRVQQMNNGHSFTTYGDMVMKIE